MAIDLNFDDQQELVRDTAREFFKANSPSDMVRRYFASPDDYPAELWRAIAELGWLGMSFRDENGGLGMGMLDSYALCLELGASLAPIPYIETVVLSGALVEKLGTVEQIRRILPAITRGELIIAPALAEREDFFDPAGIVLRADERDGGYHLTGSKMLVSNMATAGLMICSARLGTGKGEEGVTLFLVDPKAAGISWSPTANIAGLPLYAVEFDDVTVAATDVLGTPGLAWPVLKSAMLKAAILQAAMIVGAGQPILDMTVEYSKTRVQFGQQIGKHQAVQYLVTTIAMQAHNAGLLALRAAWRCDAGLPYAREAAFAKAAACRASAEMTFASHEVHAGIGFMNDYDLQLYTRRLKYLEYFLGDMRAHLEIAIDHHLHDDLDFGPALTH